MPSGRGVYGSIFVPQPESFNWFYLSSLILPFIDSFEL